MTESLEMLPFESKTSAETHPRHRHRTQESSARLTKTRGVTLEQGSPSREPPADDNPLTAHGSRGQRPNRSRRRFSRFVRKNKIYLQFGALGVLIAAVLISSGANLAVALIRLFAFRDSDVFAATLKARGMPSIRSLTEGERLEIFINRTTSSNETLLRAMLEILQGKIGARLKRSELFFSLHKLGGNVESSQKELGNPTNRASSFYKVPGSVDDSQKQLKNQKEQLKNQKNRFRSFINVGDSVENSQKQLDNQKDRVRSFINVGDSVENSQKQLDNQKDRVRSFINVGDSVEDSQKKLEDQKDRVRSFLKVGDSVKDSQKQLNPTEDRARQ
jgi:sulfur transfer protein SufE